MLTAFNALAASILALLWLCIALTFPILVVWFGVRVARDLRRIADALANQERDDGMPWQLREYFEQVPDSVLKPSVSNSMFGR